MMTRVCLGEAVYFSGYKNLLWVNPGRQPLTPCQWNGETIRRVEVKKLMD